MTYTSYKFLIFIGIVILFYYLIPNKFKKFQWVLLLCANYFFYFMNGVPQIAFIIGSTLITYGSTMLMQKLRNDNKAHVLALGENVTREQKREFKKQTQEKIKKVQVATILLHLAVLAVVKYTNVTLTNANTILDAFKVGWDIPHVSMIVPLGISFYTFSSLSYILDVARGKYEPERNFFKVALFVSYFPNIVQGPICRFDEVGTQLIAEHHFDYDRFVNGAELILWGFFKKLVIYIQGEQITRTQSVIALNRFPVAFDPL